MIGWTEAGLINAWRALACQNTTEQWRFVHFYKIGSVSIEAGCRFPFGHEAIIFSYPKSAQVNTLRLPDSKGFDVIYIDDPLVFSEKTVIALVRRPTGSLDIFTIMVIDILRALDGLCSTKISTVMDALIERIEEWQTFMARTRLPLSIEAQIGLFGELWLLKQLVGTSVGADSLDFWQGPLRAAQDFHVRQGAIEVKSTAKSSEFLATINSIEQLDSDKFPFFLCAFRFKDDSRGVLLIDLVSELFQKFEQAGTSRRFESLLMVMGYIKEHEADYTLSLSLKDATIYRVTDDMPRLARSILPAAVRSASYILNLDALEIPKYDFQELINEFGLN